MLNITKVPIESEPGIASLIVNGITDPEARCYDTPLGGGLGVAGLTEKEVIEQFGNEPFEYVGKYFSHLYYDLNEEWWYDSYVKVNVYCSTYFENPYPAIELMISTDDEDGAYAWHAIEFNEAFKSVVEQMKEAGMTYYSESEEATGYNFGIRCVAPSEQSYIKNETGRAYLILQKCIAAADLVLQRS